MATARIRVKSENRYREGASGHFGGSRQWWGHPGSRVVRLKENCPLTVSSHHRQIGAVFKTEGVENRYTIQYNPFRCAPSTILLVCGGNTILRLVQFCAGE